MSASWLDEYSAFHQDPVNRAAHLVAFPLIFLGGFGALDHVDARLSVAALGLFTVVNVTVDIVPGMLCSLLALGLRHLALELPLYVVLSALVIGAAVGIIGHVFFERRWPDNPARLARFEVVGHLWFAGWLLGRRS